MVYCRDYCLFITCQSRIEIVEVLWHRPDSCVNQYRLDFSLTFHPGYKWEAAN